MSTELPQAPDIMNTADTVARSCADAWQSLTGIGDLLADGRLNDAWAAISTTAATCWSDLAAAAQSALPILG